MDETTALFVRLPAKHARRLERAATVLPARKKDLIAGLVERYVDTDSPEGLEALRELAPSSTARPRRHVTVDVEEAGLAVGRHEFRPAPAPEVLTPAQAAELLAVEEAAVLELAEQGALPGRRIGGEWRFARQAVLDWLAAGEG